VPERWAKPESERQGRESSFFIEDQRMPPSCEEYRHLQQLLALRRRLAEDKLDPKEREEIERRIEELERELRL